MAPDPTADFFEAVTSGQVEHIGGVSDEHAYEHDDERYSDELDSDEFHDYGYGHTDSDDHELDSDEVDCDEFDDYGYGHSDSDDDGRGGDGSHSDEFGDYGHERRLGRRVRRRRVRQA